MNPEPPTKLGSEDVFSPGYALEVLSLNGESTPRYLPSNHANDSFRDLLVFLGNAAREDSRQIVTVSEWWNSIQAYTEGTSFFTFDNMRVSRAQSKGEPHLQRLLDFLMPLAGASQISRRTPVGGVNADRRSNTISSVDPADIGPDGIGFSDAVRYVDAHHCSVRTLTTRYNRNDWQGDDDETEDEAQPYSPVTEDRSRSDIVQTLREDSAALDEMITRTGHQVRARKDRSSQGASDGESEVAKMTVTEALHTVLTAYSHKSQYITCPKCSEVVEEEDLVASVHTRPILEMVAHQLSSSPNARSENKVSNLQSLDEILNAYLARHDSLGYRQNPCLKQNISQTLRIIVSNRSQRCLSDPAAIPPPSIEIGGSMSDMDIVRRVVADN